MHASELLPRLIGRGAAAGAAAGLVSAAFAVLLAEPVMDRAVRLETAREDAAAGGAHSHTEEMFTRSEQHLGLVLASVASGIALGVLFGIVYWALHRRDPDGDPWQRALRLAAVALVGLWLLPFLRYPANPPGVGDENSVGVRTAGWLGALVLGAGAVVVAWRLHALLAAAAAPVRHGVVAATLAAGLAALFLLPDNPDPVEVPATLLWDFRLLSAGTSVLLWLGLGAAFGALGLRAGRASAAAGRSPADRRRADTPA